jgi:membrane fusion protein, multidrug efflux system
MRRLLILLVVIAAVGGGWWWIAHRAPSGQAAGGTARPGAPVPVLVAKVAVRDVPIYLDGIGTVQALATVTVKTQVDGQLVAVNFKEGQDVKAGDVLAQIDPRSYQAALDLAVSKKAQDEANLANARIDLARYNKLVANAYTSAQQADTQKATVAQLVAQIAGDQASIDTARVNLGFTAIAAPVSGRIGLRLVDQGNIVHAADTTGICTITTLRPIDVLFTLPQQSLRAAQIALAAGHAETLALPQESERIDAANGVLDRGELQVIDNSVDPTTGTVKLKAEFPNAQLQLWPGGFVNVRLRVQTVKGALTIPPVAVQRGPQGTYVYLVKPDSTVERRPIALGHQDDATDIVTGGLAEGDQVVTDGASRLSEGAKVNVVEPPPNAAPAAPQPGQRPRTLQRTD